MYTWYADKKSINYVTIFEALPLWCASMIECELDVKLWETTATVTSQLPLVLTEGIRIHQMNTHNPAMVETVFLFIEEGAAFQDSHDRDCSVFWSPFISISHIIWSPPSYSNICYQEINEHWGERSAYLKFRHSTG